MGVAARVETVRGALGLGWIAWPGQRTGLGGVDGDLGTLGPLESWYDQGMTALDPGKVLLRRVQVPFINHL